MRILMLTDHYPPIIGGMERFVHSLSTELASRGHSVSVATLWHEGMPEFEVERAVRVYRIQGTAQRVRGLFSDSGRRYAPPCPDPEVVWSLRRIIESERPDIVHAHNWMIHSFLPLKPWSGARLVVSLHDYGLVCVKRDLMYHDEPCTGPALTKCLGCAANHYGFAKGVPALIANRIMSAVELAAVDTFLPVSYAAAIGAGLAGSNLPFRVIPNFIPDDYGHAPFDCESYLAQLPEQSYLLYVGSFAGHKGVDVLLRAYRELPGSTPPLVLIGFGGSTPLPTHWPNVVVARNWPHWAVMRAQERCLAGIVPSIFQETFGMAALETMAQGRPVIASQIGGLPDLVSDGENGLLVAADDPEALRRAIQRLLADPGLRNRMGQMALLRAGEFRASAVVPRFEQAYQDVLGPLDSIRGHKLGSRSEVDL